MRQSLGTAVFFGMLGVTGFGLLFTPVFYVATEWVQDLFRGSRTDSVRRLAGDEHAADGEEPRHTSERAESLVPFMK